MSLVALPSRLRLPREMVACCLEFLPYANLEDPRLAAHFMCELFEESQTELYDYLFDSGKLGGVLTTVAANWQDRSKAAAFIGAAGQIEADFAIEEAREDMLGGHARVHYH